MPKRRTKASFTLALVALAVARPASAGDGPRALSLADVVGEAFTASPVMDGYGALAREAGAEHLRALGAFDPVLTTSLEWQRELWPSPTGAPVSQGYDALVAKVLLSARTSTNVGVMVSGSAPLRSSMEWFQTPSQPQATARLTFPLLKLGEAAGPGAEARAAAIHASAARALAEDSESDLVMRVATAYWLWVASHAQVSLARRVEALVTEQLRDVDELVAQHARPPADRLVFSAAAENAMANREHAEQGVIDRQQELWATLGTARPESADGPADSLPDVPELSGDGAELAARGRASAATRPLLRQLDASIQEATVRVEAARIATRPDLDLNAQGSVSRVQIAADDPRATLGYYGGVALSLSLPLSNRAARGSHAAATEVLAQRELEAAARRGAITATIDALGHDLVTLSRTYARRVRATGEYEAAYEAERARYRAGAVTGMDVILAEQQYMAQSLQVINDRAAFAVALARYLHETGALNAPVRTRDAAQASARLRTLSRDERNP